MVQIIVDTINIINKEFLPTLNIYIHIPNIILQ